MIIDFAADACARFIDDEKITMVSLAPAMIQAMLTMLGPEDHRRALDGDASLPRPAGPCRGPSESSTQKARTARRARSARSRRAARR
jgi:hypothetical protein